MQFPSHREHLNECPSTGFQAAVPVCSTCTPGHVWCPKVTLLDAQDSGVECALRACPHAHMLLRLSHAVRGTPNVTAWTVTCFLAFTESSPASPTGRPPASHGQPEPGRSPCGWLVSERADRALGLRGLMHPGAEGVQLPSLWVFAVSVPSLHAPLA